MTQAVRRCAVLLFVLFGALFVNLNVVQVLQARSLADNPANARTLIGEYRIRRGSIIVGQGDDLTEIARSVPTDDRLRFLRRYPEGSLYAHATGFYSFVFGRTQLEETANDFLVGDAPEAFARNVADLLAGREREGDDVVTTLRPAVQEAARDALGSRTGAVTALDPTTGEVLALWSNPSYDPNPLAAHDGERVRAAWDRLREDPSQPLLSRATRGYYPPGSTFKLITAAAALDAGISPSDTFADPAELDLPQTTATIPNFGGGTCAGGGSITLDQALAVSCNTTFGQLGLDLGAQRLVAQAERFGLNQDWPFDVPVQDSFIPQPDELDAPATAQSAIGQRDVRVTPLQMAVIAGAIGNGGVVMGPRLLRQVEDFAGQVIHQFDEQPLALATGPQAMSPANAAALRDMMLGVVESGSGTGAAIPGVEVAGKTGTAQTGDERAPTVWFVGFAPAEVPQVAVAVVVEEGGELGSEATGGAVSAPIARAVMEAALDNPT